MNWNYNQTVDIVKIIAHCTQERMVIEVLFDGLCSLLAAIVVMIRQRMISVWSWCRLEFDWP